MEVHFDKEPSEEPEKWAEKWEGWHIFFTYGTWWYFKIHSVELKDYPCKEYKHGLCQMWKHRRDFKPICRYWPFHPGNLEFFPSCGFSFEKIDEGN